MRITILFKKIFYVKYFVMTKKEYIFNMSNLIKNRVLYHAPINYDGIINFQEILDRGIDLSLPVFIMEKPFKKYLIHAFEEAQKEVDFNLIIREENKKLQRKIKRCFVVKKGEINELEKLNINYKRCSKYYKIESGNYLKIGNIIENYQQKDFYLEAKEVKSGIFLTVKKFLLNGENYFIELVNTSRQKKVLEIEYNRDLDRGYYKFSKVKNGLKIVNLFTNKSTYFNAGFGKINESYSCVDGVENSSFARINFKGNIILKQYEKKCFFINYGNSSFNLKSRYDMEQFFELSKQKNYEIFDVKISSKNKFLERKFNTLIPMKIYNSWLEGKRDSESEDFYLDLKNKILLKSGKRAILQSNNLDIDDVFLFNGKKYKKVVNS